MKLTGRFAWILVLVGFSLLLIAPHSQASDWVTKQKMNTKRSFAGVAVFNGQLVVAGGLRNGAITPKVEAYSSWTNSWTTLRSLPSSRKVWGSAAVGLNNKLYLLGGYTDPGGLVMTKKVQIYNPSTNTWSDGVDLPAVCAPRGAAAVVNNKIYVLAKHAGGKKIFYVFNPAAAAGFEWSTTPFLSALDFKDYATLQAIDKKIYVIGGFDGAVSQDVEVFNTDTDPDPNKWTTLEPMPTGRAHLASGVLNGRIYAMGGWNAGSLKTVEIYNPANDTWSTGADLTYPRYGLGGGANNGTLYAVGGYDTTTSLDSTKLEAYTPVTVNVSILAPTWSSSVGKEWVSGSGVVDKWAVILRLVYQTSNVEETGVVVSKTNGSIPGLVVLVPTGDAAEPGKNWAGNFKITSVNSVGLNQVEVLAVWYVDNITATDLGYGVDASIYAAVTEGAAPSGVTDATGNGYTDELTALWLASNVAQVDFMINSAAGDASIKKKK